MTAAHHLAAAQRILSRGGQPNLAMLHMRRAAEYLAAERAAIKQDFRKAFIKLGPFSPLALFVQDLAEVVNRVGDAMREAFRSVAEHSQADFTLAGPSKGSTA